MSEPSEEAREAAEKWGNKHSGALSRGWQHVFACGYDAATAKLRAELADAEILCRELQEQRAKLSAEHERLSEENFVFRTMLDTSKKLSPEAAQPNNNEKETT